MFFAGVFHQVLWQEGCIDRSLSVSAWTDAEWFHLNSRASSALVGIGGAIAAMPGQSTMLGARCPRDAGFLDGGTPWKAVGVPLKAP